MAAFEVWAPRPQRVELDLGDHRIEMARDQRDWWRVEVPEAGPGTRYRFALDGGPPRPDPRSPSQPDGIDGPSEVVDHGSHRWTDQAWRGSPLASAILYELHVGTFSAEATFDGVADRLDHLVNLGVTAVELMPLAEFSGDRGWGYDGVLLYAPHHAYGGPDGLKRLVDACHNRGLAVVIDVVYNHLGPAGNYLGEYGPYFTDRYSTPWGEAVNFDGAGSDEVRRFFVDNALMWLREYHCDGLRLDAVHAIVDTSAAHVLEELAVEVEALAAHTGGTLWLIAESDLNDPRIVRRREVGGYGIDAQWSDDFHHALHAALTGETAGYYADFGSLGQLAVALKRAFVYDGAFSPHRHRRHGRPIGELGGDRFVCSSQNHDQVGNRALGERLAALTSPGRLRIAAALELTAPFLPMLFQGEEWAASTPFQYFTDHRDPELGRAVSQGRRNEFAAFGWRPEDVPDPQDPATWRRSVLDWEEVGKEGHAAMLDWYRRLIALRHGQPALTDGRLQRVRAWSGDDSIVLWRPPVVVVCNLAGEERVVAQAQGGTLLLASESGVTVTSEGVQLPPESVAILLTAE
jgi:maltooligosyltrehalose trehalohydrolase